MSDGHFFAVVVRPANDNSPLKPGDFDLFSGLVLGKNAVGGTHNSGKRCLTLILILVVLIKG